MVPIENSLAGSIHENYDLLLQYPDVEIVGEQKIRIVHHLIGFEGVLIDSVTRVFSHPQGLAQCAKFLDAHPGIEQVPYYDTAGSVAYVASEGRRDWAAIASAGAAKTYGLSVLKEGIETNPRNYTRFFAIARSGNSPAPDANMASIVFAVADKPGALFGCLRILSDESVNMHKLESRPIHGKPWEYMFYLDVEIPPDADRFDRAVEELTSESENFRILGRYRATGA
jgi:3-deoxy-7-phosphoheptulonate synthase